MGKVCFSFILSRQSPLNSISGYLSAHLPSPPPIHLSIDLSTALPTCSSLYSPAYTSVHPSIYLHICPSVYPPTQLSVCPSTYTSVHLPTHLAHLSTHPAIHPPISGFSAHPFSSSLSHRLHPLTTLPLLALSPSPLTEVTHPQSPPPHPPFHHPGLLLKGLRASCPTLPRIPVICHAQICPWL